MARLSALSFLIYKAAASNSVPTTTQVGNLITHFYKLCYSYIYGPGTYSADESTDTDDIIDSDEFRAILDAELSALTNAWHLAAKDNPAATPQMVLSESLKKQLKAYVRTKRGQYESIRLWGESTDDQWRPSGGIF